jgi:hypothetical protein
MSDLEEQIKAKLAEIKETEAAQKALIQQTRAAWSEKVEPLYEAILLKGYEVGALLTRDKETFRGNFKRRVTPTYGISYRTAAIYMKLSEWRNRIDEMVQQSGCAAPSSIRKANNMIKLIQRMENGDENDDDNNNDDNDDNDNQTEQEQNESSDEEDGGCYQENIRPTALVDAFVDRKFDVFVAAWRHAEWTPADLREIARHAEQLADKLESAEPIGEGAPALQ